MTRTISRQRVKESRFAARIARIKGGAIAFALLSTPALIACQGSLGMDYGQELGPDGKPLQGPKPGTIDENGNKVFATPEFNLEGEPLYSRAVLLTNDQWTRSVKDVLNLEVAPTQGDSFLQPVGGFTVFPNNERVLEVTNEMRASYQLAAAEIAKDILEQPDGIARINAGSDAGSFIQSFGRRAFRRPLTAEESTAYQGLFDIGVGLTGDEPDFVKGADLVVEAMLQSPHFLYRTELVPDGAPLTGFEVAAKLSFWILGTSPSEALLDRAAAGELDTPEGVSLVVDEMLASPAATEMAVDVYAELFKFSRYRDVIKSEEGFDPAISAELDAASRMFFQHIYESNMGLEEILTSSEGFVGPLMAPYYGISPAPASLTLTPLGAERVGYFAQVPYLMLLGDDAHSDAIHRGVFLNYQVMCAQLPAPPAVIPPLTASKPGQSDRQRIEAHTGFGTCGEGCHGGYINPLGFAFENFDGMGRLRDIDNDNVVDTSSAYPIGTQGMVPFDGAPELMSVLADSQEAHACFAKNLMTYGLQRDVVATDQALIDQLAQISMSETGSIKEILRALVKSPAFLARPGAM